MRHLFYRWDYWGHLKWGQNPGFLNARPSTWQWQPLNPEYQHWHHSGCGQLCWVPTSVSILFLLVTELPVFTWAMTTYCRHHISQDPLQLSMASWTQLWLSNTNGRVSGKCAKKRADMCLQLLYFFLLPLPFLLLVGWISSSHLEVWGGKPCAEGGGAWISKTAIHISLGVKLNKFLSYLNWCYFFVIRSWGQS